MSKPTLEEVKEYFKDALKVQNSIGLFANMENIDERGIHEWAGSYWVCDGENDNVFVWHKNIGYAEIIEYKQLPYNHNHSEERKDLNYDNLSKKKRLQIDLTFSYIDNVKKDKRIETLESRINKAIEILEPFEDGESSLPMRALKALRGDLN